MMNPIDYLQSKGILFKSIRLREVPKSAQDVERIYGCALHQVLKTLVLVGERGVVLVILPGDCRVDFAKVKNIAKQETLRLANPQEVEEITGCEIGSVSPFVVKESILKIIHNGICLMGTVNCGSGIPDLGIELTAENLCMALDGVFADVIAD